MTAPDEPTEVLGGLLTRLQSNARGSRLPPMASFGPAPEELLQSVGEIQRHGLDEFVETGEFTGVPQAQSISAVRGELISKSTRTVDKLTIELVGMLFDHVMQDKQVPAEIKARLSRLQFPVLKAALMDAAFFASSAHPARKLIDRVAGTSTGWEPYGDDNQKYLKEVDRVIAEILKNFESDLGVFDKVYSEFDRFVSDISVEDSDPVSRAKKALEAAEKHEILTINTTIQVRRAFERVDLEPYIKEFLLGPWVKVLVAASVRSEAQPGFAKAFRDVIHELVWSVQPKASTEDRGKLVKIIPGMVRVLRDGLALVNVSERERDQFFGKLMESHAMAVKPVDQAAYIKSSLLTSELRAKIDGMQLSGMFPVTTVPGGIRVPTGQIMRAAQEHHADIVMPDPLTDIARLDPVEDARVQEEIGRWQRGNWFKLWNGTEFVRVKLRWMSPLRTLFLFAARARSQGARAVCRHAEVLPGAQVHRTARKRRTDQARRRRGCRGLRERAGPRGKSRQAVQGVRSRPHEPRRMNPKDGAAALKAAAPPPARERHAAPAVPNGRVTGGYVLKQLVADGLLATSDAERFKISGGRDRAGHPLVNLAEMNYRTPNSRAEAHRPRDADAVAGAEVLAAVLPHRSAARRLHACRRRDVLVVCDDLFDPAGRDERRRGDDRDLRAVPDRLGTRDRADHEEEGQARRLESTRRRALHDRVLQAGAAGQGRGQDGRHAAGVQLRAAGRTRRQGRRPTTRMSSTSSTGCCSMRSTSAPATSTSSHGASRASPASASMACCIRSTRCRPA